MDSISPANNTRIVATFIILFTGSLFLFNTGNRDLWAPDEPRYAQVAKEMRDSSNFLVPHLNKEPYPDKPPFLFWLINVFSLTFGKITPLSSRLPSAFAGIGCCLAIFYFGKSLYRNTRIALLAALILATSIKFLWMAHRVAFDVILTFLVTAAIFSFYKGYTLQRGRKSPLFLTFSPPENGDEEGKKSRSVFYYTLFYIFMAIGVLTKGPVGFILPFLIILTYLTLKRDVGILKETRPWIGGTLFFFIVFTWVYLASVYGGKEYTYQILFKQNVGRFANSFAHKRPFYYYFINFPLNFFPWSVFIPGIAIYLFSKKGKGKIQEILLPFVWFSVIFVFFSFVSGKRDIYVLPLYPAASLLISWFLNEFIIQFRERHFKRIGYIPCYILCGLSFALGVLSPIMVYRYFPQYTALTIPFVVIFFIGGVIMFRFLMYARILPFLFVLIFMIFLTFNVGTVMAIPVLNQYKSAKEICDKANSVMKPHEKLAMYNFFRDPYLFYTNRNYIEVIYGLENLRQFLNSDERVFFFIQEKDFNEISKSPEIHVFVLGRDSVGHRAVLFVSNKDI